MGYHRGIMTFAYPTGMWQKAMMPRLNIRKDTPYFCSVKIYANGCKPA